MNNNNNQINTHYCGQFLLIIITQTMDLQFGPLLAIVPTVLQVFVITHCF